MSTREKTKAELESMLDGGHTLANIVAMLAEVCEEKAEWVESPESIGLPDHKLARAWRSAARKLDRAGGQLCAGIVEAAGI